LEIARRRLNRTPFLSDADDHKLRYLNRPERGIIIFPVDEVSPLVLDGAAGYSSQDDEFYGKFNATLSNVLGKGRQLKLEWAKKDKESRWLKIGYDEPYPFNIPFKLSLEFYQDDRDSTFIESGGSVGLHYLGSDIYSYGVAVGVSRLDPESYGQLFLPNKTKLRVSVSLSADTRDYPLNPRNGEYLLLKADFISETTEADSLFPASNTNYRTAELKAQKLLPVAGSSILYFGFHAMGDFSENIPTDRQFPLGGFGSLRGYMQDQFYVSRKAVGTIEFRLLTSRRGRAYIFGDGAMYQTPKLGDDGSDTEFISGFGIGLAASVRLGIATVEIAVPSKVGFGDTKLHFGLRAGF
jgi:outer membrane protein assembly factor BamA